MWQRFSKPSKAAVFMAQKVAERTGALEVLPVHLAFGALSVDGLAWGALAVDEPISNHLLAAFESVISRSEGAGCPVTSLVLSATGKDAITRAYELSKTPRISNSTGIMGRLRAAAGWTRICTDHVLLACIQVDPDSRQALALPVCEIQLRSSCQESKDEPIAPNAEVSLSPIGNLLVDGSPQ
jgi:hypothetical protein